MQEENAARYAELLRTARFRDVLRGGGGNGEGDAGGVLAVKLAMAWFGLPVAPIGRGLGGSEDEEDESGDEKEREGQALRFLNGYSGERAYGRDVGLRRPDPILETYFVKPTRRARLGKRTSWGGTASLSLRGGEAASQEEDDAPPASGASSPPVEDESTPQPGQLRLRGGGPFDDSTDDNSGLDDEGDTGKNPSRWSSEDDFTKSLYTPLGGISSGTEKQWVPLYGYQGVVWFRLDLLYTFVDAVDRLLGLDNRAGVTYSLYLLDKEKSYTSQAERDAFLSDLNGNGLTIWPSGAGDYSHDQLAWEWVLDRLGVVEEGKEPEYHRKALFVAGPADPVPWTWQPRPSHRVLKLVLDWANAPEMNRPDVAYIRMPENPKDVVYTNQFGPWMAQVCRVLAAGRIPGRPGYPAIPDAWFTVESKDRESSAVGTYGGLAFLPQLWASIIAHWQKDKSTPVTLVARTPRTISDRWHLFLPGLAHPYEKQYILHSEVDDVKTVRRRIVSLLKNSMSSDSYRRIRSLEVHVPGAGFFIVSEAAPELVVSMTADDPDSAFQPVVDRLVHWKRWLEAMPGVPPVSNGLGLFPQFIALRPVFDEYTICDGDETAEPLTWDPDATSVSQFRRLVARVWTANASSRRNVPTRSWIAITQGRPRKAASKKGSADVAGNKPRLLVGPSTTDTEWYAIRSMIVEPDVFVSPVAETNLPRFGDSITGQPFGYRDIYDTPRALLYQALEKDQFPSSARHFDWQLWGEDVTPQLKTVRPWEEQPESLSAFYEHDEFPLKPPPGTRQVSAYRDAHETGEPRNRPVERTAGFQVVTDVERGQRLREYSYAHPLDVQMHTSIPINAPPVDALLNLRQDSVPVVSLSVLTPTEVRRLQRDYHDMRNLVLSRTERCPYADCDAMYPANQPSAMQQHLQEKHRATAAAAPAPAPAPPPPAAAGAAAPPPAKPARKPKAKASAKAKPTPPAKPKQPAAAAAAAATPAPRSAKPARKQPPTIPPSSRVTRSAAAARSSTASSSASAPQAAAAATTTTTPTTITAIITNDTTTTTTNNNNDVETAATTTSEIPAHHTAKAARTVTYAEPLVRDASPASPASPAVGVGGLRRGQRRLAPAIRARARPEHVRARA
ncbi:uncharacterized protein THITE_2145404 [Thermothielavioides terrestris NRRL 8126]|uniref:Uncharacterized protein n=1 Tax=Thermothielavioides terrestris (strain ATCC 38088 / NRRL 8126) TaxID=578455 RepID=G2R8D6_THETT|nr:uncharacterized protein THITE_2145404 [Thermothielavioides terrestris NRRL 8126]AEO68194.1 hypothetical protein THITE_2145404 [Thermothielavioides terrestris NRRL 8126]